MNKEKTTESLNSKSNIYIKDKKDFLKYYEKPDTRFSDNILKSEVFWREQVIDGIETGKVEIKQAIPWNKKVTKEINKIKD